MKNKAPIAKSGDTGNETLLKEKVYVAPIFDPRGMMEYFGSVNYATNERVLCDIKEHKAHTPKMELTLVVTSAGGPSGVGFAFYDAVTLILKPRLNTIGSGDVDSSGMLIFLTGEKRYITPHTTVLLHLAGRCFDGGKRFTASEIESMSREDMIKDTQYASVLAASSDGKLSSGEVIDMMRRNCVLTPPELVSFGLAHEILLI